jgi:protein-S-isoprenylcysteine O-methyltransferase Ste14
MERATAVVGTALFFLVAPFVAAAVVPWWITGWQFRAAFLGIELTRMIGVVLIAAGAPGVVDSFARFALEGLGTPAPVAPPKTLVVTGLYRYVRNPMYVGVLTALGGWSLLYASRDLALYGAGIWFGFHFFVLLYEEPILHRKFGDSYARYRANVSRWLPGRAWHG